MSRLHLGPISTNRAGSLLGQFSRKTLPLISRRPSPLSTIATAIAPFMIAVTSLGCAETKSTLPAPKPTQAETPQLTPEEPASKPEYPDPYFEQIAGKYDWDKEYAPVADLFTAVTKTLQADSRIVTMERLASLMKAGFLGEEIFNKYDWEAFGRELTSTDDDFKTDNRYRTMRWADQLIDMDVIGGVVFKTTGRGIPGPYTSYRDWGIGGSRPAWDEPFELIFLEFHDYDITSILGGLSCNKPLNKYDDLEFAIAQNVTALLYKAEPFYLKENAIKDPTYLSPIFRRLSRIAPKIGDSSKTNREAVLAVRALRLFIELKLISPNRISAQAKNKFKAFVANSAFYGNDDLTEAAINLCQSGLVKGETVAVAMQTIHYLSSGIFSAQGEDLAKAVQQLNKQGLISSSHFPSGFFPAVVQKFMESRGENIAALRRAVFFLESGLLRNDDVPDQFVDLLLHIAASYNHIKVDLALRGFAALAQANHPQVAVIKARVLELGSDYPSFRYTSNSERYQKRDFYAAVVHGELWKFLYSKGFSGQNDRVSALVSTKDFHSAYFRCRPQDKAAFFETIYEWLQSDNPTAEFKKAWTKKQEQARSTATDG